MLELNHTGNEWNGVDQNAVLTMSVGGSEDC